MKIKKNYYTWIVDLVTSVLIITCDYHSHDVTMLTCFDHVSAGEAFLEYVLIVSHSESSKTQGVVLKVIKEVVLIIT